MASSDVSAVTNLVPRVNEGFSTTVAVPGITSGGTSVPLTSVSGLTNATIFVGIVEPGLTNEQTFTGTVDTAGSQITGVKWTRGTNTAHAAGTTVVDYTTGTHFNMLGKHLLTQHTQTGTHGAVTATSLTTSGNISVGGTSTLTGNVTVAGTLTVAGSSSDGSWTPISGTISAATYNGNHSYSLTTSSDNTASISPGMRLRTTRTVAAPTQSTSLNGSSQYYSKSSPAGMTATDDIVVSAHIKLTSYPTSGNGRGTILSRYNGTSGFIFDVTNAGTVELFGFNAGGANYSGVSSSQSIPLNKWVHVAIQLDMSSFTASSTTSYVLIDGADVPCSVLRGGTNPTAFIQAGNLEIGSENGGTKLFPGKIAQAAVYSAKVTQANIRATISQGLSGSETSLISAYSFNNSINDLNANANNLSANGSAVATNADSPFGGQASGSISSTLDYGIVQSISASTIVVQVPEGCTIPTSGGISACSYSSVKSPYGFPGQNGKWRVVSLLLVDIGTTANATNYGSFANGGYALTVPIGAWNVGTIMNGYMSATIDIIWCLSSASIIGSPSTASQGKMATLIHASSASAAGWSAFLSEQVTTPTALTYVMYTVGNSSAAALQATISQNYIYADNAYL